MALQVTEELLTLPEAEALTKRKVATWRKDIQLKRIPYVRLGRQVRIPREVINQMISKGWHEPVSADAAVVNGLKANL